MISLQQLSLFLIVCLTTTGTVQSSVPLLFCANERADHAECQEELASARQSITPWFAQYNRRNLLDCRRFCSEKYEERYLTFQMPCECSTISTPAKTVTLPMPGKLEGPVQMFHAFVDKLSEGRCKENLSEMKCYVTFVSGYTYESSNGDGLGELSGVHFLDMDADDTGSGTTSGSSSGTTASSSGSTGSGTTGQQGFQILDDEEIHQPDPSVANQVGEGMVLVDDPIPTERPTQSPIPRPDISFDKEDDILPKVPKEKPPVQVGGED